MMRSFQLMHGKRLWRVLPAVVVAALSGAIGAAEPGAQSSRPAADSAPPKMELAKPVPPSTAETVDAAFKKLAIGKNYVAREDARLLEGFDKVFEATDADQDERLSFDEFRNAWKAYIAREKSSRG